MVAACCLWDLVLHWRQLGVLAGVVLGADIARKREEGGSGIGVEVWEEIGEQLANWCKLYTS